MDNQFIKTLKQVIDKYGLEICNSTKIFNSLLADFSNGEFYKERKLLILVLDTQCHKALSPKIEVEEWKNKSISQLNKEEFIDKNRAVWAIDMLFNNIIGEQYYISKGEYYIKKIIFWMQKFLLIKL